MDAKGILEEVRAEEQRRFKENGNQPLPRQEEAELRRWKVERYTEAIRLDPACAEAYVERGTEFHFLGRRAEAQADMRKAYSLHPKDPELYHMMAFPFEGDEQRTVLRRGMDLADPSSWEHEDLRSYFIRSYWYEGSFSEFVRQLEAWVPHLDPSSLFYRHELQDLAMGYSALGEHQKAEDAYRRALPACTGIERASVAEMIVRCRVHRNEHALARAALEELALEVPSDRKVMFDAALSVLLAPLSEETRSACVAALPVAEPLGQAPGPLGNSTSYFSFLLGLVYKGAGRTEAAVEILNRFAREAEANKREWAITLRWEIATAREQALNE